LAGLVAGKRAAIDDDRALPPAGEVIRARNSQAVSSPNQLPGTRRISE
jgi:hypothetical protein